MFFEKILDFIAPRHCLVCGELLGEFRNDYICNQCIDNIPYSSDSNIILKRLLMNFGNLDMAVDKAMALMEVSTLSPYMNLIYDLKYAGLKQIGTELGYMLGEVILKDGGGDVDFIQPVPIHKARIRERGYNQSDYIAKGISKVINKPMITDIASRKIYTGTQTKLSGEQRQKNVKDIFEIKNNNYNRVLIVDDVLTTGSTLNNLAMAFKHKEYENVEIASIVFIKG